MHLLYALHLCMSHTARKANSVMLAAVGVVLKKACSERKECELFL